tara:strand:+ start:676 stop:1782 length:1107 start_codon:yes stop_codon:yes gene_type:complete
MKIGLLTIFKSTNYGAVLQAYATKKAFSKYGEVKLINYNTSYLSNTFKLLRFNFSVHGIKMLVHDLLRLPYSLSLFYKFKVFIRNNLSPTKPFTQKELAHGKAKEFKVLVCGSDQIWNPDVVNKDGEFDATYYLSFGTKEQKKISFASSIGHHIFTTKEKAIVKDVLNDFSNISIREKDGVAKIKEVFPNRKVAHINDPTLLLSKEEWLETFHIQEDKNAEDYILVYSVPHSDLMKKAVKYFSEKFKIKVVSIDKMLLSFTKTDKQVRNAGPKEFLKLFADAKFVITDSFHGTCFSVNFAKPFVTISPGKKSNRISSLLSILELEQHLVSSEKEFESIAPSLDYKTAHVALENIRKESKQFIKEAMES